MLYRLKAGRHSRIEGKDKDGRSVRKLYRPIRPEHPEGDLIDLTREEAKELGARVTPHIPHVDDEVTDEEVLAAAAAEPSAPAKSVPPTESVEPTESVPPTDPSEWEAIAGMNVGDVEEMVSGLSDAADLRDIYAVEEAGKRRVGVFNAVRYRLAALQDSPAEDAGDADAAEE